MFKNICKLIICTRLFVILIDNEKLKISKKKLLKQAAESGKSQTLTKRKNIQKYFFEMAHWFYFFIYHQNVSLYGILI